ncbi:uncharacterized protein LOC110442627 [Mizuhopecten yessoensis]|uniref:Acyl-ACP thioesterase n=1 Tax=Mizuhopecten yessoensis TaxID=6573 RepID=A0A210PGP9_MIZYE|nr:uncharacterized protein LOC110442627 [Mizuhopecten yessoensis]OWF35684.1 hypothetical protein KP79_PYT04893 [Mizuhopecten yessoensis]
MAFYEIVHDSLARVDIHVNGLPSQFFDRTNNLSVWSIVELFLNAGSPPNVKEFTRRQDLYRTRQIMQFVVQISCSVTPEIHLISKYNKSTNRLVMSTDIHEFGTSSFSLKSSMSNRETKEKLGDFFIKLVTVNMKTRKSCPLPKWYVEKFRDVPGFNTNPPYPKPKIPEMPEVIYHVTVTARFSDMDGNNHVTTHRYMQFFTDCATEAANCGFYKHFTNDMCWYPVETFDVTLLGESKVGDKLRVCTWQDGADIQRVYFNCFNDGKCVMKASFVYGLNTITPKIPPHYL